MPSQLEQAQLLMPAVQKLAASAYAPLTEQYPELASLMENVPESRWNFFFITASIGVTFLLAPVQVAEEAQSQVCDTVAAALEAWHPQGYEALEDFLKFVREKLATRSGNARGGGCLVVLELEAGPADSRRTQSRLAPGPVFLA